MLKRLLFFIAIPCIAQDSRVISSVKGSVISDQPLAGSHLISELLEAVSHKQLARSYVGGDGSFEFRDVASGIYSVEVGTASGDPIARLTVAIKGGGDQIEIRLPVRQNKPAASGTVSLRELLHPVSGKSKKIFEAAQKASEAGDFLKAIEILRGALNDASAVAYARMNIGVAYLKVGQPASAIPNLQESARLIPEDSLAHSNLAYALLLTKHLDEAEAECRLAIQLDRNNSKARWMMGSILLNKGSHEEEAVEDLRSASRDMPNARVILAQFYARHGQKDAAVRELREFLPRASGAEKESVEKWLATLTTRADGEVK